MKINFLHNPRAGEMLDRLVGAHGVHVLGVWGLGEVGEGAGLHNNLIDSVTCNVSYLCISFYSL